jgi:hypothetical protein
VPAFTSRALMLRTARAGFTFELPLGTATPHGATQLVLTTTDDSGARFVPYAAPLATAVIDGAARRFEYRESWWHGERGRMVYRERHLEGEVADLQARLAAIETTRTWRLRRRLRRLLGLSEIAPSDQR